MANWKLSLDAQVIELDKAVFDLNALISGNQNGIERYQAEKMSAFNREKIEEYQNAIKNYEAKRDQLQNEFNRTKFFAEQSIRFLGPYLVSMQEHVASSSQPPKPI